MSLKYTCVFIFHFLPESINLENKIIKILISVLIPIPFSPEQCQCKSVLGASRDALRLTKCLWWE